MEIHYFSSLTINLPDLFTASWDKAYTPNTAIFCAQALGLPSVQLQTNQTTVGEIKRRTKPSNPKILSTKGTWGHGDTGKLRPKVVVKENTFVIGWTLSQKGMHTMGNPLRKLQRQKGITPLYSQVDGTQHIHVYKVNNYWSSGKKTWQHLLPFVVGSNFIL